MKSIQAAVLMSAGFGTRLRPLTSHIAKPALPFFNKPVILHLIDRLIAAGIRTVYVNLHYQAWSIRRAIRQYRRKDVSVVFSHEPEILGTAGVLGPLHHFLKSAPFLLVNGDVATDVDLGKLIVQHCSSHDVIATVTLHPPSSDRGFPQIGAGCGNRLTRFPYGPLKSGAADWSGTFAGLHVINPNIFQFVRKRSFQCINSDVYARALNAGYSIGAFRHDGYWSDIGTISGYLTAHMDVLNGHLRLPGLQLKTKETWIHPTAHVSPKARLESGVVVGANALIDKNVSLRNVIVWPGAKVESGRVLNNGVFTNRRIWVPVSKE